MSSLTPDETILGLLASQKQHGYQLLEAFNDPLRLGKVWKLSTSQLYAVLKRLERQNWITGLEQESASAPPRIEYTITDTGRSVLHAWMYDPEPSPSVRRVRVEFLSRLYIAQLLQQSVESIIAWQRSACRAELTRYESVHASEGISGLASDLVIMQLDALLHWIDRCAFVLASIPVSHSENEVES